MLTKHAEELLQPRRNSLLARLADEIDSAHLRAIAEADYGYDANDHYAALDGIRSQLSVPKPLEWVPREVLELIRWSRPENPGWKPGLTGPPGHLIRAFSCSALLSAGWDEESRDFITDENQTLAALVESLGVLGVDYERAGLSSLGWRVQNPLKEWEDEPFFWFSLLILALRVFGNAEPDLVSEFANMVLASEQSVRDADWHVLPEVSEPWLLGLTFFDLNHYLWKRRIKELRGIAVTLEEENQRVVARMANALQGDD